MSEDYEKTESMNDTLNSDEEEKEPLLASYQSSLASSRSASPEPQSESESESEPPDANSTQPPVSRLKRISLFIFFALLSWLTYSKVFHTKGKPKIIHASRSVKFSEPLRRLLIELCLKRYSKEFKFRPAASPVITETLKDGRIRLRGALPEPTAQPTPAVVKKKRGPKAGKASYGGRKSTGTNSKIRAVNQRRK